jgi:glycosyltransferase involved in cell wall biosynthesis
MSRQIKDIAVGFGVEPGRVRVVYTGVDTAATVSAVEVERVKERYGLLPFQPVIGTVANLFPRKGYEYLIEALTDIRRVIPHVHCLIIGEGEEHYCKRLLGMVEEKKLKENVTFAGFQQNVLSHISSMDVFVLPSIMEGFGIVLLEAMAMAKPVVATAVGGIPEVVEDKVSGFLVSPKDSRALAQRILYLLENPQIRHQMGQAGRARVVEQFSVERMVTQLQGFYDELVSEPLV